MKSLFAAAAFGAITASLAFAQPTVTGLANNYSWIQPGLPNYGIAQGSIFVIFGTGLAGAATPLQSIPLQTTLNGVSSSVVVNGITTHPIFYYVAPTALGVILPSATPVGTGKITVTYSGQTSAPFNIQVVKSAFGLLTANGAGNGPAKVINYTASTGGNVSYLGPTTAANSGDVLELWGSGLGPVTGDETKLQVQQDLTNTDGPIEVDIGGIKATVQYQGRSQYPGLDQINVYVPAGVTGCYVSVVVIANNVVSNFANIPVAASGRTCSDPTSTLPPSQLQNLLNKSSFTLGGVSIGQTVAYNPGITIGGIQIQPTSTFHTDNGSGSFARWTPAQYNAATNIGVSSASIGSCIVYTYTGSTDPTTGLPQATALNAGTPINVSGPNGTKGMPYQNGIYYATLGGGTLPGPVLPVFIPPTGGTFNFIGPGGPDIGAFNAQITMAAPLVWSDMIAITTAGVTRANGVTVHWTGGDPSTYVQISGASFLVNATPVVAAIFVCTAPVSAKQFTVPPAVLLSLPPSGSISGFTVGGSLSVSNYTNPQTFTAPNLDYGYVSAYVTNSTQVVYQ